MSRGRSAAASGSAPHACGNGPHSSATSHSLRLLGVAGPLHPDFRGRRIDLSEVVGSQFDGRCPQVLLQSMQLRSARNRYDPRFLCKQPGERDLGGRRLLALPDPAEQIDQRLVCFPVFFIETMDGAPKIRAVERGAGGNLARQEALT